MDYNSNSDDNNSAAVRLASDLLCGFDIQDDDSRDYLSSLIAAGQVPQPELRELVDLALMRGKEEWDMIFACAGAIRSRSLEDDREDPGLTPYLAYVLSAEAVINEPQKRRVIKNEKKRQRKRSEPKRKTSRFWQDEKAAGSKSDETLHETPQVDDDPSLSSSRIPIHRSESAVGEATVTLAKPSSRNDLCSLLEDAPEGAILDRLINTARSSSFSPPLLSAHHHTPTLKRARSIISPFFTPSPTKKPPRPPRGTISGLPFPPLSSPHFGLIQESLSHDTFRLLVAVTFLIRTAGKAAIPVFHRVMERFPTPEAFVEADMEAELVPMIAHLGLPARRCAAIGKYAKIWTERPPVPGVKHVVRGYPRQNACPMDDVERQGEGDDEEREDKAGEEEETVGVRQAEESGSRSTSVTPETAKRSKSKLNSSEWEIGHLTQGQYAIDSWRIFCRDIFLGKSDSWMGPPGRLGSGNVEPLEPEWMRVLPEDKELRACLRWMWMREGFEWDPLNGSKSPLREEMRMAVENGRIKYDEKGELVILDGPVGAVEDDDGRN
ncbi:hypothetical protein BR93DRAFT_923503 [Coniochaeta sp. PMI_546]|nr:hypothetical protein BR93DRAFT_923503 [Coniochaeta sp. PMI_546]